ncbi:flippase-like domain-containing protein [Caulobacter sp. RL271]|uniref:Flippase-like domain-containing protein n=1 Tax=Caulobacter segnis TaxID=88688 RepID=A0ABY4ZND3_9CAUL|nr:flippase-like domain-containing protein [Caulobacter segnis]USQ94114.1 flippase-like domain-containing protein [Caulobacter segnis]
MTADSGMATAAGAKPSPWRGWLLTAGIGLLAVFLATHGVGAVREIVAQVGWQAVLVVLAHLPVTFLAMVGWQVLLPPDRRPSMGFLFRVRLIKEAVNALLPVAQVGGDVVRAKLSVRNGLTLAEATASCVVDVLTGTVGLVLFVLTSLVVAMVTLHDPRLAQAGLALVGIVAAIAAALYVAHKAGVGRRVGQFSQRWTAIAGRVGELGDAFRGIGRQRANLFASWAWHMAAWIAGAFETYVSMWALGLNPTLMQALIVEGLAQTAKVVGFAIPGALGVQEGGYLLLGGALGLTPDQALALSLLRRLRELTLGAVGLVLWRATRPEPVTASPEPAKA